MSALPDRMLTLDEVCQATSLSPATIWRMIAKGRFPSQFRLSENRVGWSLVQVRSWLATRQIVAK